MVELLIDLLSKTIKASEADYIMLATKLFENGLVYIPFKIGDIVYVIVDKSIILEGKVKRISIDKKNNIRFVVDRPSLNSPYDTSGTYNVSSINRTVFRTKNEAEEFLKGGKYASRNKE